MTPLNSLSVMTESYKMIKEFNIVTAHLKKDGLGPTGTESTSTESTITDPKVADLTSTDPKVADLTVTDPNKFVIEGEDEDPKIIKKMIDLTEEQKDKVGTEITIGQWVQWIYTNKNDLYGKVVRQFKDETVDVGFIGDKGITYFNFPKKSLIIINHILSTTDIEGTTGELQKRWEKAIQTEKTQANQNVTQKGGNGVAVGTFVNWLRADADIPSGTVGKVIRNFGTTVEVCFISSKGLKCFTFARTSLIKVDEPTDKTEWNKRQFLIDKRQGKIQLNEEGVKGEEGEEGEGKEGEDKGGNYQKQREFKLELIKKFKELAIYVIHHPGDLNNNTTYNDIVEKYLKILNEYDESKHDKDQLDDVIKSLKEKLNEDKWDEIINEIDSLHLPDSSKDSA
jgi:hypothetical protein